MIARAIRPNVFWVGAIDFGRRLFDALIPTPEGTSYNAYLVKGYDKTALIDTVDTGLHPVLLDNLKEAGVKRLDYIVINHAEQDHSGSLPILLERYPEAVVITNEKCRDQLHLLFQLPAGRIRVIRDRETLDLGGQTLEFIFAPWVHWPETMFTWLREERILFSCDFLGAHLGSSQLFVDDLNLVYEPAKRYYAEIMMPYRQHVKSHLEKLAPLDIDMVAPSHGPIHRQPRHILAAYREWSSDAVQNEVVLAYVSMHGSTERMVETLACHLIKRGITTAVFDLTKTDLGRLAITLVDAATLIMATPTVMFGPHPLAVQAAYVINTLKPKTRHLGVIGSYGWAGKTPDTLLSMLESLKAETIPPVFIKGAPKDDHLPQLETLAADILSRHQKLGLG